MGTLTRKAFQKTLDKYDEGQIKKLSAQILNDLEDFDIIREWADDGCLCFSAIITLKNGTKSEELEFWWSEIPPYEYFKESAKAKKDFINWLASQFEMALCDIVELDDEKELNEENVDIEHLKILRFAGLIK